MKNTLWFLIVIVVGALLGLFIGKAIGLLVPPGAVRDLFVMEQKTGLTPSTLDLKVIELTLGCMLKFNISSVIGIILAAFLFKRIQQ